MVNMKFRNLDLNNDWTFGKGTNNYVKDNQAIILDVETALLSWVGDCWFSLSDYVDWKNRLDKGQEINLEAELSTVIVQRQGVVTVNQLNVNLDASRNFTISYDITTIFSQSVQNSITIGQ